MENTKGRKTNRFNIWEGQPALTKFTIFRKLPTELRLRIWRHAVSHRQFITVLASTCKRCNSISTEFVWMNHRPTPRFANNVMLAIAHVNVEAREQALKTYAFTTFGVLDRPVIFDFSRDGLLFKQERGLAHFNTMLTQASDKEMVRQKLAHLIVRLQRDHLVGQDTFDSISKMTGLKSASFVMNTLYADAEGFEVWVNHHLRREMKQLPCVTVNYLLLNMSGDMILKGACRDRACKFIEFTNS
jgi:2EXR family